MYNGKTVGVVVPAYNEEGRVGEVLDTVPAFVDRVYVVDDGSTDGTWAEIRRRAERANGSRPDAAVADGGGTFQRRVVPIRHAENRGVGGAIKTGYLRALDDGIDVTAILAGDGQMDPDLLDRLIDPVVEGKADYAKGNRLLSRPDHRSMPTVRLVGNAILTFLTKLASGYWSIGDPQNGYTAISRHALEAVGIEEMYEFYGYCNDLLVKLNVNGMTVADVATPAIYGDETSQIRYRSYIPNVSTMLFRNFLWRLKVKYVITDFHPLVLLYGIGVFGGAVWLIETLGAVVTRESRSGRPRSMAAGLLSALMVVLAMIYDRKANEHLNADTLHSRDDR